MNDMMWNKLLASGGAATAIALAFALPQPVGAAPQRHRVIQQRVVPRSERPTPARFVPRGAGVKQVTVTFNKTPIQAALQVLFRRADKSFVLGPGVSGTTTLSLHNVSFDTALKQMLSVNSVPLVSTLRNGIYVIKARHVAYRRRYRRPNINITYRRPPTYRPPTVRPPAYFPGRPYSVPATGGTVRVVP